MTSDIPRHVAIIMDGNGRWALQRGLSRVEGHRAGAESVKDAIRFCLENDIEYLTLFALSVENRQHRPKAEVEMLFSLFLSALKDNLDELHAHGVRVKIIGDQSDFDEHLCQQIHDTETLTQNNTKLTLMIAIHYSGRWDLLQAMQKIINTSQTSPSEIEITETLISSAMETSQCPDPDLLIRTSGEQRISNFMLWQLAYTELYFTDTLWPDFNVQAFEAAIQDYTKRHRRFGSTHEPKEDRYA